MSSSAQLSLPRTRDFLEIVVTFAAVLATLWSTGRVQAIAGLLTFAWVVAATLRSRQNAALLGLRFSDIRQSLWVVAVAVLAAGSLIAIAWKMHTLHAVLRGLTPETSFLAYFLWALVQQFILQNFFLVRMLRLFPTRTAAVVVTGMLFAVAHLPNPLLTVATLAWGITACSLFLRYRNLYTLGLAHAVFGISLAIAIPNALHHQMRVGIGYLEWRPPQPLIHRSQINHIVSTEAWVIADATSRRSSRHALP